MHITRSILHPYFIQMRYVYLVKMSISFLRVMIAITARRYIRQASTLWSWPRRVFTNDIFREYRVKYEHIILVAGQRGYEEAMADYIREAAKKKRQNACMYMYQEILMQNLYSIRKMSSIVQELTSTSI